MSNDFDGLITVRLADESDANLILATFLRGLYYGNKFFNMVPKDEFMEVYKLVLRNLLAKSITQVACLVDDPSVIVAYVSTSPDGKLLHWCYTKEAWRKQGIVRAMLPKTLTNFTHFSSFGLILNKKRKLIFNPFKIQ